MGRPGSLSDFMINKIKVIDTRGFRKEVLVAMGLRIFAVSLLFFMNTIVARNLGAEGYGLFNYAIVIAGVMSLFAPLGWPISVMKLIPQYLDQKHFKLLKGLIQRSLQVSVVSSFLMSGLLLLLSCFESLSDLSFSLVSAAIFLPFLTIVNIRSRILRGLHHTKDSIVFDQILTPFLMILGVYCLNISNVNNAVLMYSFVGYAVVIVSGIWLMKQRLPVEVRSTQSAFETKKWFVLALPMAFGSGGQFLIDRIDLIFLGVVENIETVGFYGAAARVSILLTFVLQTINLVIAPKLSSAYHKGDKMQFKELVRKSMLWSGLSALPLFVLMIFFSEFLMGLFGHDFREGHAYLEVLLLGQFANACTGSVGIALMMAGKERQVAYLIGLVLIINITLYAVVFPVWGSIGIAWATVAGHTLLNVVFYYMVRRL